MFFGTCNNCGSELVRLGFSPDVIFIDGAGQLTMSALACVLTSFTQWQACIVFGDPNQLLPYISSGLANEFRENASLSVLSLLEEKGYPMLRLELQYRMAPAIVQWPAQFFYKGLLRNHPSVLEDSHYRSVARDICKQDYGINGVTGNGSETWMIDVANGVSRVQLNGTSLQYHANADRIATLVDQTLSRGVEASKISVLVYYTGQLSLMGHKIEAKAEANGRNWQLSPGYQISTVDSFQGEETEFVFIDLVTAHQAEQRPNNTESDDDDGTEAFKKSSGRVTAHVKSANRLCCALTRGRSCVVVVGQLTALLSTTKARQQKSHAAVSAMAKDFVDRCLVYHDYDSLDTSKVGIKQRAKWDAAKLAAEINQKKAQDLDFRTLGLRMAGHARFDDVSQDKTPMVFRTSSRRTTRPNLRGVAATQADDYDNRRGKLTEAGPVPFTVSGGTQRKAKDAKKAAREQKAAEEAERERVSEEAMRSGKGKGKALPVVVVERGESSKMAGKTGEEMDKT